MTHMAKLMDTLERIRQIKSDLSTNSALAKNVAFHMGKLRIGYDEYGNRRVPSDMINWAESVNGKIKRELATELSLKYSDKLIEYCVELQTLRAVLPQYAASAAIELGTLVRELEQQAYDIKMGKSDG